MVSKNVESASVNLQQKSICFMAALNIIVWIMWRTQILCTSMFFFPKAIQRREDSRRPICKYIPEDSQRLSWPKSEGSCCPEKRTNGNGTECMEEGWEGRCLCTGRQGRRDRWRARSRLTGQRTGEDRKGEGRGRQGLRGQTGGTDGQGGKLEDW